MSSNVKNKAKALSSTSSLTYKSKSKIEIKDLCPEEKQKVGELVMKYAKVYKEKNELLKENEEIKRRFLKAPLENQLDQVDQINDSSNVITYNNTSLIKDSQVSEYFITNTTTEFKNNNDIDYNNESYEMNDYTSSKIILIKDKFKRMYDKLKDSISSFEISEKEKDKEKDLKYKNNTQSENQIRNIINKNDDYQSKSTVRLNKNEENHEKIEVLKRKVFEQYLSNSNDHLLDNNDNNLMTKQVLSLKKNEERNEKNEGRNRKININRHDSSHDSDDEPIERDDLGSGEREEVEIKKEISKKKLKYKEMLLKAKKKSIEIDEIQRKHEKRHGKNENLDGSTMRNSHLMEEGKLNYEECNIVIDILNKKSLSSFNNLYQYMPYNSGNSNLNSSNLGYSIDYMNKTSFMDYKEKNLN